MECLQPMARVSNKFKFLKCLGNVTLCPINFHCNFVQVLSLFPNEFPSQSVSHLNKVC